MKILVVDDNTMIAVAAPYAYLQSQLPDRVNDFEFIPLTDPTKVADKLAEHSDIAAVLVDMHFNMVSPHSGLLVLDALAKPDLPPAIGYCQPDESRSLFKYAACQLMERPPAGWVTRNDADLIELIRLLDAINTTAGRHVPPSPSLVRCYPGVPGTGDLMRRILHRPYDARMWRSLATTEPGYDDLGSEGAIASKTARTRIEEYYEAIVDYEKAIVADAPGFARTGECVSLGSYESAVRGKPRSVLRVVDKFARLHRMFFTAIELPGLVERHTKREREQREQRDRRRRR
ncbi:hypothetical protein [Nocardia sp. NPDC056000]|uniref:hypothetical protein n=1 Tax=Nocardia sp. NPDC056000 TaxID=3345674 RepID=UPI0035DD0C8C